MIAWSCRILLCWLERRNVNSTLHSQKALQNAQHHLANVLFEQVPNEKGVIEEGRKVPKKNVDIELWGLWGRNEPSPLQASVFTPKGWPAVSTPVLRSLAGKPGAALKALSELYPESAQALKPVERPELGEPSYQFLPIPVRLVNDTGQIGRRSQSDRSTIPVRLVRLMFYLMLVQR